MNRKKRYVQDISATQLHEVMAGADMFLVFLAAGILTKEMVKEMAENPIILLCKPRSRNFT